MLNNRAYQWVLTYFLCYALLFPFGWEVFGVQSTISEFLFGPLLRTVHSHYTDLSPFDGSIYSDTIDHVIFTGAMLPLSLLIFAFITRKNEEKRALYFSCVRLFLTYYLALVLLKYGWEKWTKVQFYAPEPNLLYTRLGDLDRDILYWSTIGSSLSYNRFLAVMELLPAVLLLFARTRNFGYLISVMVFVQVVAVNFSYDISVKLFSTFLLVLSSVLFLPNLQRSISFFSGKSAPAVTLLRGKSLIKNAKIYGASKILLISILLLETLYGTVKAQNWNDDLRPKLPFHGAYKIDRGAHPFTELFIHRDYYLIFKDSNSVMHDFKLYYGSDGKSITLIDYDGVSTEFEFETKPKLRLINKELGFDITAEPLPWKSMPLRKQ